MKKRIITTLSFLVILILLVIYANKYEVDEVLAPGQQKFVSVLGVKDTEIKSITFGNEDKTEVKIAFENDKSKIVYPHDYSCDDAEAFGIIRALSELMTDNYFDYVASSSIDYGFNNSNWIKVETSNSSQELTLGGKTAIGDSYYLKKKDDSKIYIVPSNIRGVFNKRLNTLRNRYLFNEDFDKCASIEYNNGKVKFNLIHDDQYSQWKLHEINAFADQVEVANLINNMRNIRITNFEDATDVDNEKYGFSDPSLNIKITCNNGKTYELIAGSLFGTDTFVTVDKKIVQRVDTVKLHELLLSQNDLREKYLDLINFSSLNEIVIKHSDKELKLTKKDKRWQYIDTNLSENNIKNFISSLTKQRILEFCEMKEKENCGFNNLEQCQSLELISDDKSLKYYIGDKKEYFTYIMDDKDIMKISSEFITNFDKFIAIIENIKK